ncbi:histidine phosphatase family protein, partial [Heyndrickxia faecalis]|uniref:histidine phosphatase family protein n=1 Tax=Heyndrickxia faecalis TaxID=2824910 RepID=UPI003D219D6A
EFTLQSCKLHATFDNLDLKYSGGESSKEAMDRIVNVVIDSLESEHESTVIVTHGNIMSLLLHHFDKNFGFEQWKELTNPDVYLLNSFDEKINYTRLWDE